MCDLFEQRLDVGVLGLLAAGLLIKGAVEAFRLAERDVDVDGMLTRSIGRLPHGLLLFARHRRAEQPGMHDPLARKDPVQGIIRLTAEQSLPLLAAQPRQIRTQCHVVSSFVILSHMLRSFIDINYHFDVLLF